MIEQTYAALKARLEEHPQLSGRVFDSVVYEPDGTLRTDPYLVLFPALPDELVAGRCTAVSDYNATGTFVYDMRAVGDSVTLTMRVMDKALGQTVGHRLMIPGRSCDPMTVESSSGVRHDAGVKPPLFFADVGLELINRPA